MYNQYGYKCPIDWSEVPSNINWITMENGDLPRIKTMFSIPKLIIVGHESPPYATFYKKEFKWMSEHRYQRIATISDVDLLELLLRVNQCYVVVYAKCIWQRPQL